jgi:long-chain acyl-CoA synthetase
MRFLLTENQLVFLKCRSLRGNQMIFTNILLNASQNFPKKIGFIDYDKEFTFEELTYRAAQVKRSLIELGVKKRDRVAILMSNDFRYMELIFGITAIGAILVPLNTRLHPKELAGILNDSQAETLYLGGEFRSIFSEIREVVMTLKNVIIIDSEMENGQELSYDYEKLIKSFPNETLKAEDVDEDDIAGLYYTSGTTGRPKGVIHTHKSLISTANNYMEFMMCKKDDRWLHTVPMFHIGGIMMFLSYTSVGATQVTLRSFDTKVLLRLFEEKKITATFLVPTMVNMVLNDPNFNLYDKSSLERIVYSSSPMPVEILNHAFEKLPNVKFSHVFGATEVPMMITLSDNYHKPPGNENEIKRLQSCGQPYKGMIGKIIKPGGEETPIGEVGEIVAKGPTVAKGYWGLAEETSKSFREDGWYFTGDLGYKDEENFYYIVDRAKDMIISGAENIYSNEIEDVLYRYPAILECAVIGVPDEKWGEAVKAVIITKSGYSVTEEEVKTFARNYLANYKVPKSVDFVEELPKNSIGKIQKHQLRKRYWEDKSKMVN